MAEQLAPLSLFLLRILMCTVCQATVVLHIEMHMILSLLCSSDMKHHQDKQVVDVWEYAAKAHEVFM